MTSARSPPQFKLTRDMVDVWGGKGSPLWTEFIELMTAGMAAMQRHHVEIVSRDAPPRCARDIAQRLRQPTS